MLYARFTVNKKKMSSTTIRKTIQKIDKETVKLLNEQPNVAAEECCAKCVKPLKGKESVPVVTEEEHIDWERWVDFDVFSEPDEPYESWSARCCTHSVHSACKKKMAPEGFLTHRYRYCRFCKLMFWNE